MTRKDVESIVYECLDDWTAKIVAIKPRMTTKEVAMVIGKSKSYVLANKERFNPKRVDKRGKLEFDTKTVINYHNGNK